MSISDSVRKAIRNYLRIEENTESISITVKQLFDFEGQCFVNNLWYRGSADELSAFYKQFNDRLGNTNFWASAPSKSVRVRKIHTGLPALIVDKLADVCTSDLYDIEAGDRTEEWEAIADENNFKQLVKNATRDVLIFGDGCFKFSYDADISQLPIIEFFPGDRVEYEYRRGRLIGVIFKTEKYIKDSVYILKERYTADGISYSLEKADGKEVDLHSFEEFANLEDITNKAKFMAAVPYMVKESAQYKGRGKSIYSGKLDNFDAFDEIVSHWLLAVRKGQIKEYIPESFIPRDIETGAMLEFSDFDNSFISVAGDMSENGTRKIETTQGIIQHEALLSTYCTILDLCLQGIISPSTLGIDVKKLDNAEAQREKEKTTLYTRDDVLAALEPVLKKVVSIALKFKDNLEMKVSDDVEVTVSFGGYANPAFEAQVETIGKAASTNIMSIETQVDELYGDSKDDEWKAAEVERIKIEKGIITVDEPGVNDEVKQRPIGFEG